MISFKNKNILITGASGGIGNELVKKFVSLGGIVLATGTKSEKLDNLKKEFPNINADPEGSIISQQEWEKRCDEWLPSDSDQSFVQSLMKPVTEPGKIAGWIAPPKGRINRQSFEFEYVRFN